MAASTATTPSLNMTRREDCDAPRALITGGSGGIGRAIAATIVQAGGRVVLLGRVRPSSPPPRRSSAQR